VATADSRPITFPPEFLWGTATSAYQIEGSPEAAGRGVSIWDTFSHTPGRTHNGDSGDFGADHYRRLESDLDLLAELGAPAYRFSIAWPRIQPTGKGPANLEGLDFYKRLVDGLKERGIASVATLYHWDLPQPLEDAGGWVERDTVDRFGEYAAIAAEALGSDVSLWTTLNEPWCSAWLGYGKGEHAPGLKDVGKAAAASHHLLVAHGEAVKAVRSVLPEAKIGITLNLTHATPGTDHPDDEAAARRVDGNQNRIYLDPIFRGRYPEDMLEHYSKHRPGFTVIRDGDLETISVPIDFLGVNFYSPSTVVARTRSQAAREAGYNVSPPRPDPVSEDLGELSVETPGREQTLMGWEIEADGLKSLLVRLKKEYTSLPVYVTENGAAAEDYVAPDGHIRDPERVSYLAAHLKATHEAIEQGVDVRGYFVWSFLDNFEWAYGYAKRFGLVWVDYPSGTRTPKESFYWYKQVAARNGLA
jgi:beta-glucosidase